LCAPRQCIPQCKQAASAAEHEKAQSVVRAEDEQLKNALVESAIEDEEFAE